MMPTKLVLCASCAKTPILRRGLGQDGTDTSGGSTDTSGIDTSGGTTDNSGDTSGIDTSGGMSTDTSGSSSTDTSGSSTGWLTAAGNALKNIFGGSSSTNQASTTSSGWSTPTSSGSSSGIPPWVWLALGVGAVITVVKETGRPRYRPRRRGRRRNPARRRRNPYELVVQTSHSRYKRSFATKSEARRAATVVRKRLKRIGPGLKDVTVVVRKEP